MSWLDIAKQKLNAAKASLNKFMNSAVINGIGAAVALEAMADGTLDPSEETKVLDEISGTDSVAKWAPEIANAFEANVAKLRKGTMGAKAEVRAAVKGIPARSEAASVTVAIMIAVGGADGNFDPKEQAVVKDVARMLEIEKDTLDQYADLFTATK